MSLRKPVLLLSSSGGVALSNTLTGCCTHQSPPPPPRRRCCSTRPVKKKTATRRAKGYATEASKSSGRHNDSANDLPWPNLGSPARAPTPYEIFCQKRGEAYSKRRFYELVKLYHPDRYKQIKQDEAPAKSAASPAVMLERYRLVIAANAILSDPAQKADYDKYGVGWTSSSVADLWPSATSHHAKHKYSTTHRWHKDGPTAYRWPPEQDPMYNATWEDWERWYYRQQYSQYRSSSSSSSSSSGWTDSFFSSSRRRQQGPVYASNHAFISTVFVLAALGGVGQATRIGENNRWRVERTNIVSERTSRNLSQARQDARDRREIGETKDQRIRRFLSEHDNYEAGEFDARAARQGDDSLCASGTVKDKDNPRFWERPPERPPAKPPKKNP